MRSASSLSVAFCLVLGGCGGKGSGSNDNLNGNLNDNLNNNNSAPVCGNGVVDGVEECDDGAQNSDTVPDACRSDCTNPRCGDGVTDSGEACDDGAQNSDTEPGACRRDCGLPACGDGVIDPASGETCDDGEENSDSAPGACRTTCSPAGCGDDVLDPGEVCDDGNAVAGDGCSVYCDSDETCGNGIVDSAKGEVCDDGPDNSDAPDTPDCRTSCQPRRCGDGILDAQQGEACDDGGSEEGDGCSAACLVDPRWVCQGSPSACACDTYFHGAACDQCIVFVNPDPAILSRDGASWATALATIQGGIDQASALAYPCEVWVTQGVHTIFAGQMSDTLSLRADVAVYGGFVGTESTRNERDSLDNVTILDGGASQKVLHVVTATSVQNAVLDGFTIRNGYAQGNGLDGRGGGIFASGSSVTVRNCVLTSNRAAGGHEPSWDPALGGALYSTGSQVTVVSSRFQDNRAQMIWLAGGMNTGTQAEARGGAIASFASTVTVLDSTFIANLSQADTSPFDPNLVAGKAFASGGAIFSSDSQLLLERSHLESNQVAAACNCMLTSAHYHCGEAAGGALDQQGGDLVVSRSRLHSNFVNYGAGSCSGGGPPPSFGYGSTYGGGLNNSASTCHLENTVITFNRMSAMSGLLNFPPPDYEVQGGGVRLETPCSLLHCTLADNVILEPPGVDTNPQWGGQGLYGDFTESVGSTVTNSILWNGPFGLKGLLPSISYSDCDAFSLPPGPGNIQAYPMFDLPSYRLLDDSPCIDVADDSAAPLLDLDGNGRFDLPGVGTSVADMGAFEYQGL